MTKDVLVTISGKRLMGAGDDEDVELVTPGTYSHKNGMHVVRYEEAAEGTDLATMNEIMIGGGGMQIKKSGFANVQMDFLNRSDRTTSCYSTPFGDFVVGITTRDISVKETDDRLLVDVSYAMDVGDEHLSDCQIRVEVNSRGC